MNRVLFSHEHLFQNGKILFSLLFSLSLPLVAVQNLTFEKASGSGFIPGTPSVVQSITPSIGAAMHIAGVDYATSGISKNFDLIAEIVVKNTGDEDLFNLNLTTDLGSAVWLGTGFVSVVDGPEIIMSGTHGNITNATLPPGVNASFNGNGNLLDSGGLLEPGQTFIVRIRIEVDPDAPGAPVIPKMQVVAWGDAPDGSGGFITVTDESDSGFDPQGLNSGWPGSPGGFNDPTPLTNCWQILGGGISCNNNSQLSVDQTCTANLNPEMVLEGEFQHCTGDMLFPLGGYYRVAGVETQNGIPVPDLDTTTVNVYEISGAYVGQTLWVKVMDVVHKNSCWGQITLEDKLAPVFDCPTEPYALFCNQDTNEVPYPTVTDNCDPAPLVVLTGQQVLDNDICDDGIYRIQRTYKATDIHGNQSGFCTVQIHITRPMVDFPEDITWHCSQYDAFPNITQPIALDPAITDTDPADGDIDVSATLADSILAITGSGMVNVAGGLCAYQVIPYDQVLTSCGTSFKIIRTWTVIDWCTGNFVFTGVGGEDNSQIIKIMDLTPPSISMSPFEVNANIPAQHPQPCRSQGFLLPPVVDDNCNAVSVKIMTPVGEATYLPGGGNQGGFIPAPGLTIGTHNITYTATDACGNHTSIVVPVTVLDNITPAAVCDAVTEVSLTTTGKATVLAQTFDDGSSDNCCIDHFEVRRMTDNCDDGHDDTVFGPSIVFCCNDLSANPVTVVFRVYDCYENYNDCMVEVEVSDNQVPVVTSCPPQQRITCDFYADNLEEQLDQLAGSPSAQSQLLDAQFGTAAFFDNCSFTVQRTFARNLDQCREGVITRSWKATDSTGNNSSACTQNIFVDHVSDWVVSFPADITIHCGTAVPSFDQPQVFHNSCEIIATSYDDELFTTVPDACYKIVRTWQIINWCVVGSEVNQEVLETAEEFIGLPYPACDFDGDGDCDNRTFRDSWNTTHQPGIAQATQSTNPDTDPDSDPWDGYITYKQVIKVIDNIDPVFSAGCAIPDVCVDETSCSATVLLPTPAIQECSPQVTLTATGSLGNGTGPFVNVPVGTYTVTYLATDNCNNQTTCHTTVKVKDCTKPQVYCDDLITEIMSLPTPMVPVNAILLDAGSSDYCSEELHFSFTPNIADSVKLYFCDQTGIPDTVEIWVTDAAGNQDFCKTTVTVQDNMGACNDPLVASVGGQINNETGTHIGNVAVNMNGQASGSMTTGPSGSYLFTGVPLGSDISVTPLRDDNHLNGVTTFDMVQISKHILGIAPLNSPYKRIAADVNNSQNITTFDLVEIRKLVLLINDKFPNNTSWRFVGKNYVFPVPTNPWAEPFPEIISINNIPADVLDADFVAIKVGDVNNSASFAGEAGERSTSGSLLLEAKDARLAAGDWYTVDLMARDFVVNGFQFTLDFDPQKLEFQEIKPSLTDASHIGLTLLDEGAITVSWNEYGENWWEDKPVMSLVFRAKSTCQLSQALHLGSRFTPAEAYDLQDKMLDVKLQFTENETIGHFELFQNKPNPFERETTVGFYLPAAGPASLTITDVSGKVIKRMEDEFSQGYHEVRLERRDLPSSGIFYYRLETAFGSASKKMILLQ